VVEQELAVIYVPVSEESERWRRIGHDPVRPGAPPAGPSMPGPRPPPVL